MAAHAFIIALVFLGQHSTALQVTPNSPCASYCIDSNDLDFSDPNSSNTRNKDITCYDKEYTTTAAGQKFHRCLTCLQESTFSQGQENDQAWFLYNIRYTFDYCVFGFPNASGVASTPCSTSTACGGLEVALTGDKLNAVGLDPYDYCSADGDAMSGPSVAKCEACVGASDGQNLLANFMVALDAGCNQKPEAGTLVGLNDTVFSPTIISAADPTAPSTSSNEDSGLPTSSVVGIIAGVLLVILVIAAVFLIRHRKRRNRRLRLQGSPKFGSSRPGLHRRESSWSFRCQTHLSPRSPAFSPTIVEESAQKEKEFGDLSPESTVSGHSMWSAKQGFRPAARPYRGGDNAGVPLCNIATTVPTIPDNVHYSTSPKANAFSPDDIATPQSTTSTKSTAQLLPVKPYNPADYSFTVPQYSGETNTTTYSSPTSASTASPLISRTWDQRNPQWDKPLPQRKASRAGGGNVKNVFTGGGRGKRVCSNDGSPVESKEINVDFPAPPPRR